MLRQKEGTERKVLWETGLNKILDTAVLRPRIDFYSTFQAITDRTKDNFIVRKIKLRTQSNKTTQA